jgi:hypothetical protein
VVVLVITLLMGIGAFAARSAHIATQASGSERQMTQAHYVAEYGAMFAYAQFSNNGGKGQAIFKAMRNPSPTELCYSQTAGQPLRTCYRLLKTDIQNDINASYNVCDIVNGTTPGSLGMANAECDFVAEIADLSEGANASGYQAAAGIGKTNPMKFWYVTVTTTGQVRIVNSGATLSATSAESSGTQTLRGRYLIGPYAP